MKVIIFGATGMVGQAVLRECRADERVKKILLISRSTVPLEQTNRPASPEILQIRHDDFLDFTAIGPEMTGYDACFFCLGVSAAGRTEPEYRRVTYFITMAAARDLAELDPAMRFLYISGAGTDSTERGRLMWARIKGETENAILALPFDGYALRPGYIQPLAGVRSRNSLYRSAYRLMGWLYPLLRRVAPKYVIGSDQLARAMINLAADGSDRRILDSPALLALAG